MTTETHRMKWTLNTVWYLFLPIMEKFGIKVTRGYIKSLVKTFCEAAGITRESLGIYAGVRAELYFNGNWTSVSFDSITSLAEKGTDIVFVEKEGIPEVLTDFADKYGIAMVNTRGHLTEYGKDLMNVAKALGAHVVIMADYDATGVKIASESPSEMPWIGANDAMLVSKTATPPIFQGVSCLKDFYPLTRLSLNQSLSLNLNLNLNLEQ